MTLIETTEILGNVAEVLGSIAVLATLAYLSVQMRHANRSAALAAMQANRAERRAWFLANRDSPYLAPIEIKRANGEALTPEETRRFSAHVACDFSLLYSEWVNRDIGLAGEYAISDTAYLEVFRASQAHRDWWRANGRRIYAARFCDHVDQWLAE